MVGNCIRAAGLETWLGAGFGQSPAGTSAWFGVFGVFGALLDPFLSFPAFSSVLTDTVRSPRIISRNIHPNSTSRLFQISGEPLLPSPRSFHV